MRTSVIINNYNYGHFACEAIASALRQTIQPDEIILIDDGSTDDSVIKLEREFYHEPRVRIIRQPNGGMLSTHNRGFLESTGDILFFLDADDLYEPRRIELALLLFKENPDVGITFSPMTVFGEREGFMFCWKTKLQWMDLKKGQTPDSKNILFNRPLCDAYILLRFVGAATSSLAIRRTVLEKFLPLNLENEWRNHSDNCLVYGSALTGTQAFYLGTPLINYRAHGKNDFLGHLQSKQKRDALEKRTSDLVIYLAQKFRLPPKNAPVIWQEIVRKLSSHPVPWNEYNRYARRLRRIGFSPKSILFWRIRLFLAYLRGRMHF